MSLYSPGGWVRFTRAWEWDLPSRKGRYTKTFSSGAEVRLTGPQLQSAIAAGAVVSIPNPREARTQEASDA